MLEKLNAFLSGKLNLTIMGPVSIHEAEVRFAKES
jgi:hypothetical protein